MAIGSSNDNLMSEINVTPFVDVMLVLLIIFMVTAPMMIQGVDVSLPEATSGALTPEDEQLVISVDRKKQVFINDLKVEVDFLREKLFKILETRKSRNVFLRADKDVSYGMVMLVMAEVKGAGVEKLGMLTEPENEVKKSRK